MSAYTPNSKEFRAVWLIIAMGMAIRKRRLHDTYFKGITVVSIDFSAERAQN